MPSRKPFLLRIDPGLWDELESWAKDEFRSVNGQIEYLLRQAMQRRKGGMQRDTSTAPSQPPSKDN
jgi:hypothetical protein